MLTLNDGRSELWQWDTGRTLSVDQGCTQVHFSNKVFGRSIDVDVVDGVAIIPDVLLQTDKDLVAWAFVGAPENGYTKISKVFKVNKRNKPADYVFTPPEQTTLEEIKEKIEYLESIQDPDAIKNAVDEYLNENPVETPVKSVNGKTGDVKLTSEDVGAISHDDLQEATNQALAQAKESGEFDGKDGQDGSPGKDGSDGVSATHSWNGTTLTITSASGTSSADLKGDKGDKGDPGAAGYTPVKGLDYFTEEEKTEMVSDILDSIPVDSVYGATPVFETTTTEAVAYVEYNAKRFKSVLVTVETAEHSSTQSNCYVFSGGAGVADVYLGTPQTNAVAYVEIFSLRGRWRTSSIGMTTNKNILSNYGHGTSYQTLGKSVAQFPVIDLVRVYNLPANTKVRIYGVEENA